MHNQLHDVRVQANSKDRKQVTQDYAHCQQPVQGVPKATLRFDNSLKGLTEVTASCYT
jgi:hypothetical protein